MLRHVSWCAVGLLALGVSASAQQALFKGDVRTVAVYATVRDANGRLVPDLPQDAFTVEDNGRPQPLTVFANDIQPITAVVLLDRSGSMRANFSLVEQAAEEFVNALGPGDKARIGSFSNRIQVDPRDFTSDHEELLKILRTDLQPEGPTPLWNAVNVGITALLHQTGRRVILVFTDGVDEPMNFSNMNASLKDVMKRAEQEDVMVYAIGLAGDNGPHAGLHGGFGPPVVGIGSRGGFGRGGSVPGGAGFRRGSEEPDKGLAKIAAQTGGGYFELTSVDDLAGTFRRVADELHHQYLIGFAPPTLDGKMHKLEVRLANADMTVRARRSYLATTPAS
jgi:VWFA-related protein